MDDTILLDSGYTQAGVRWEVRRYKLRYASVHFVRVNGQEVHRFGDNVEDRFGGIADCYKYLEQSNVQKFSKKFLDDGKTRYVPVVEHVHGQQPKPTTPDDSTTGTAQSG
jgi:hypothetical protein